ncbi:MAG TPA: HEAT repeat domain-containing protein [Vicinamibacterales bacterium]|jgi:HEAT repeat protein|nr:HEAT repeat domain-containing protein [Vicinamibacterales bacterium]
MRKICAVLCLLAAAPIVGAQTLRFDDVVRNLRNPDAKTRLASVKLLRDAKYPEAIEPLAPLVNDPVDEIQLETIAAELSFYLGQDVRSRRMVAFVIEKRQSAVAEAAFQLGPAAVWPQPVPRTLVSSLLTAIDDETPRVRSEATYALGVIARPPLDAAAAQQLVKALDHYDPAIRAAAALVIGRLNVTAAGDELIKAVNDSQAEVRYAAMRALGYIHEARAIPTLQQQLAFYKKGEGAWSALDGLARMGSSSTAPVLKPYLTDKDPYLRRSAAEGLGRAGDTSQVDALGRMATTDESPMVRLAACFALQKLGQNYVTRLVDLLTNDKLAQQGVESLVELGPPIAPQLYARLQEPQPQTREAIADVLGMIGGAGALPALQTVAADKDPDVAAAAKRAMARIRGPQ